MIKLIKKFIFPLFFLISSSAFAGLMTDLPKSTYISKGGYDWTWASPVNQTNYSEAVGFGSVGFENIFEDASFHAGWREFDESDIVIQSIFEAFLLSDFTRIDGSIIHSAAYWNSYYTDVNIDDFSFRLGKKIESDTYKFFETFYVRVTPSQVPEPSTIMIFAIALIALSLRKRAIK
jgi:hypothetical protein